MPPVRTLIVDDSALVRKIVTQSLAQDAEIEVVGTATDPYVARDKILELKPDVITLDIEMPRMDGITFLRLLMQHRPMPVIVMSSLTQAGSTKAFEALEAGAVDVIGKPSGSQSASADGSLLAAKIKAAAQARLRPRSGVASPPPGRPAEPAATGLSTSRTSSLGSHQPASRDLPSSTASQGRSYSPREIILIGSSTGGTEALAAILPQLPADLPGICIVQHIPAYFSRSLAERLNNLCALEVREAQRGDKVQPGVALIAPGGFHMLLRWAGTHYTVELNEGPPIHFQRPAVDILFDSAIRAGAGHHTLAGILTGMGADGAAGLLKLKQAGAATFAQNEETCVVFGMPREAIRLGAAQEILALENVAAHIDGCAASAALRPTELLAAR